jgi:hypothetical protein
MKMIIIGVLTSAVFVTSSSLFAATGTCYGASHKGEMQQKGYCGVYTGKCIGKNSILIPPTPDQAPAGSCKAWPTGVAYSENPNGSLGNTPKKKTIKESNASSIE